MAMTGQIARSFTIWKQAIEYTLGEHLPAALQYTRSLLVSRLVPGLGASPSPGRHSCSIRRVRTHGPEGSQATSSRLRRSAALSQSAAVTLWARRIRALTLIVVGVVRALLGLPLVPATGAMTAAAMNGKINISFH